MNCDISLSHISSTLQDVWVLPTGDVGSSEGKPFPFVQTSANEFHGQLSPDSQWMSYTSDESGQREVYIRPFPRGDGRWKISTAGGEQPRWRGDGLELFYAAPGGTLLAVPIKRQSGSEPLIEPGVPVPLFDSLMMATGTNIDNVFQYDVTADGKRFLVVRTGADSSGPPLTVIVNWARGFLE